MIQNKHHDDWLASRKASLVDSLAGLSAYSKACWIAFGLSEASVNFFYIAENSTILLGFEKDLRAVSLVNVERWTKKIYKQF